MRLALDQFVKECDEALATGDLAATFEKDSQLHLEIARLTGNSHLYEIFEKIDAKVQLLRLVLHLPVERLTMFIGQHKAIIHAMRRHDQKLAETLMYNHIMEQLHYYHPTVP